MHANVRCPSAFFPGLVYLGIIALLVAVVSSIMVFLGVQAMRTEETAGRAEPRGRGAPRFAAFRRSTLAAMTSSTGYPMYTYASSARLAQLDKNPRLHAHTLTRELTICL
jgi:hypothetical protein